MIRSKEKFYHSVWSNNRFSSSRSIREMLHKPFHEVLDVRYCENCSRHYRHILKPYGFRDMLEGFHARHRRLLRRGYSPEFVEFRYEWLRENFEEYIIWQPRWTFFLPCSHGGRFESNTVHLQPHKELPYIKRVHPKVCFFELYDYLLCNYHSNHSMALDSEAYKKELTQDLKVMMRMSKEEFEVEMALRDVAS